MNENFEQYCIVELFGHMVVAGLVTEQTIGGQSFVRVDVPETGKNTAFTKFYGAGAIYAMTPVDKATCMAAVDGLRAKPIQEYTLNLPTLPERSQDDDDDSDDDCDDDDRGFDYSDNSRIDQELGW